MAERAEKEEKVTIRGAFIDAGAPLILGFVAYSIASALTFHQPSRFHIDTLEIALYTSAAGLMVMGLGYVSIVLLGGVCSLGTAGLIGKLTKTKQVIRPKEGKLLHFRKVLIEKSHLIYLPVVLFFTSIALGWDIYSFVKTPAAERDTLEVVLQSLNFFAIPARHPTAASGVIFSLRLLPGLIVITAISGLAPSIALPYFRRFKIIGINGGPFHSTLLTAVVGPIIGLNILVSLLGIFYNVLWAEAPVSYHYALLVLIGFSLHYSAGTYIGRSRAESIILRRLANGRYNRKRILVLDRTLDPKAEAIELGAILRPQLED
jgi:hypothetical protein